MSELVVSGYLREISSIIDQTVPDIVSFICVNFYSYTNLIFLALQSENDSRNGIRIANIEKQKAWTMSIYDVGNITNIGKKQKPTSINTCGGGEAGYCHTSSIQLPHTISSKLSDYSMHNLNYNIIFKGGGYADTQHNGYEQLNDFNAVIYNSKQLDMSHMTEIIGYNWKLPNYPQKVQGLNCVYNERNESVIGIGGYNPRNITRYSNKVYSLCLSETDFDYLKWNKLSKMKEMRSHCTSAIINENDHGRNLLMVIGGRCGSVHLQSVELYDFAFNKWKFIASMNTARCGASAYTMKLTNRVYIGGAASYGEHSKCVEYYEMHKNEWYDLSKTNMTHTNKPLLWSNGINLMYMASIGSGVEFMDIRDSSNKWEMFVHSLQDVFKIEIMVHDDVADESDESDENDESVESVESDDFVLFF